MWAFKCAVICQLGWIFFIKFPAILEIKKIFFWSKKRFKFKYFSSTLWNIRKGKWICIIGKITYTKKNKKKPAIMSIYPENIYRQEINHWRDLKRENKKKFVSKNRFPIFQFFGTLLMFNQGESLFPYLSEKFVISHLEFFLLIILSTEKKKKKN